MKEAQKLNSLRSSAVLNDLPDATSVAAQQQFRHISESVEDRFMAPDMQTSSISHVQSKPPQSEAGSSSAAPELQSNATGGGSGDQRNRSDPNSDSLQRALTEQQKQPSSIGSAGRSNASQFDPLQVPLRNHVGRASRANRATIMPNVLGVAGGANGPLGALGTALAPLQQGRHPSACRRPSADAQMESGAMYLSQMGMSIDEAAAGDTQNVSDVAQDPDLDVETDLPLVESLIPEGIWKKFEKRERERQKVLHGVHELF